MIVVCKECNGTHNLADNGWNTVVCTICNAEIPNPHTTQGAHKFDQNKLPYELLAPEFLEATANVLRFGATKYGSRNWEKGMAWGRPFGACMRHLWAWWRGEKCDAETGASHLHHAACCLMFLIAYEERQIGEDDRV